MHRPNATTAVSGDSVRRSPPREWPRLPGPVYVCCVNVLFVCSAHVRRSRTAEEIYRDDPRFTVRSAGLGELTDRPVNEELLEWADLVAVMEAEQRRFIMDRFPRASHWARIVVLGIPDVYSFRDPALVDEIRSRFERAYLRHRELQRQSGDGS